MKQFLISLFFLSSFCIFTSLYGQDRKCAANDVMERQIADNPSFAARMLAIEKHTQEFVAQNRKNTTNAKKPDNPGGGKPKPPTPPPLPPSEFTEVTIPVVVHILFNNSTEESAKDRVDEQMKILNDDFAATNTDITNHIPTEYSSVVSSGAKISFCLKETKLVPTSESAFSTNDAMKFSSSNGSDAVDPDKNLNIWVCNMSGGILGYAQFPGGSLATDGVVILHSAFGNTSGYYNKGRTATHEVGHYFNLRHIWGDRRCGNDLVDDTPLHDGANYRCPGEGATSNCKGQIVEMWMNYMDYTFDECMYMFSSDQALRMQATLASGGPRAGMVEPNYECPATATAASSRTNDIFENETISTSISDFKVYPTITSGNVFFQMQSSNTGIKELGIFNQSGILVNRKRISVVNGVNTQELNLGNLANGFYLIKLLDGSDHRIQKLIVQH
jgi:hypothetical protein